MPNQLVNCRSSVLPICTMGYMRVRTCFWMARQPGASRAGRAGTYDRRSTMSLRASLFEYYRPRQKQRIPLVSGSQNKQAGGAGRGRDKDIPGHGVVDGGLSMVVWSKLHDRRALRVDSALNAYRARQPAGSNPGVKHELGQPANCWRGVDREGVKTRNR